MEKGGLGGAEPSPCSAAAPSSSSPPPSFSSSTAATAGAAPWQHKIRSDEGHGDAYTHRCGVVGLLGLATVRHRCDERWRRSSLVGRAFSDAPPLHEHRGSQRSHSHGVGGTWAIARTASSSGNSSPEISTTQSSSPSSITPGGRAPSDLREQNVCKGNGHSAALLRRVRVQHWGQCQQ